MAAAVESHQVSEVSDNMASLRAAAAEVARSMKIRVACKQVALPVTKPGGSKLIHFIRHGEGTHNVAQREWRADPAWDGQTEPYTIDTDPNMKFVDAELNDIGIRQAKDLQQATAKVKPELMIVSPMRRATLTGLLAFAPQIERGEMLIIAHELAHERAGKHTCDKRLSKTELGKLFPAVDYSLIDAEEDPFWGDGLTREPWQDLGKRAGAFIEWLMEREDEHIAVAAHSAMYCGRTLHTRAHMARAPGLLAT